MWVTGVNLQCQVTWRLREESVPIDKLYKAEPINAVLRNHQRTFHFRPDATQPISILPLPFPSSTVFEDETVRPLRTGMRIPMGTSLFYALM